MIGRSGLFGDIMCPYDEDGCPRPHCHFWHSKDDTQSSGYAGVVASSSSSAKVEQTAQQQPFAGYVGYVGSTAAEMSAGYVGTIYSPASPEARPSAASLRTANNAKSSTRGSKSDEPPVKRSSSPLLESLPKPSVPVELEVDAILDPSNDTAKRKEPEVVNAAPENPAEAPKHVRERMLNEYVKSVADIDTRIEELQKAIEREKRQKERIVHEIKAKVQPTEPANDDDGYVPTKRALLEPKQSKPSSKYSGGYTPTPIAILNSKAKKAMEREKEKEREREKEKERQREKDKEKEEQKERERKEKEKEKEKERVKEKTKAREREKEKERERIKKDENHKRILKEEVREKQSKKLKLSDGVSIEDLFDEEEPEAPPAKKLKVEKRLEKKPEVRKVVEARPAPSAQLSSIQVELAKKRIADATAAQVSARLRVGPVKSRVPTVAQQLWSRYEKLQKEKEEILRKVQEKRAEASGGGRDGTFVGTVEKGEKRVAHSLNKTSAIALNITPLEPCSSSKVALGVRQRYLELFHTECLKFCESPAEALNQAQQEEKSIKDRAGTKAIYANAAVNTLRRLREISAAPSSSVVKGVSHSEVLAGRHHGSITIGQRGKGFLRGSQVLTEREFAEALSQKYLLTMEQLEENCYPMWENEERKAIKLVVSERDSKKKLYADEDDLKRTCCRCGAEFRLKPNGEYAVKDECVHHWGRAYKTKTRGNWESRYSCCASDLNVKGCCVADYHVTDTSPKSELYNFVETPPPLGSCDPRSGRVYALDCEMVYTAMGMALARISVVDIRDELVLDVLVRPRTTVLDYNTRFSGLTEEQLANAEYDFDQAREQLFAFVNSETILIGHSLESDLKAMRIVHRKVVDTSVVYPHRLGPPYKRALKTITSEVLQLIIQEDVTGHDSKEDSSACMKLMLHKVKHD